MQTHKHTSSRGGETQRTLNRAREGSTASGQDERERVGGSLSDFLSASFAHLSVRGARGTSFVFIERREKKWWFSYFFSVLHHLIFPCNFVEEPRLLDIRMSEWHASKGAYSSNSKVIIGKARVPSNGVLEHSLCMP